MLRTLKWTGVMLGVLASACLASHHAKVRREGNGSTGPDAAGPHRSDVRQPDTHLDAGGQTA